jgi:predicted membrane-bound spermidine synthase
LARADNRRVVLAGLVFFLSGASALVYQVAWQRVLALHSGVGLYSIAMIVAAFMAGLGIGSLLGGRASARVGPGRALRLFAALELLIGAFGALSPLVYYDWLYPLASGLPSPSLRGGLLHFLALVPPTTLMGMSLPFLVRAMVREVRSAGRTIGYLYGTNVLGAAAGALVAPWLLIPAGGIRGASGIAAVLNGLAGLGALALRGGGEGAPEAAASPGAGEEAPARHPFSLWLSLYALSGFVALSLEIVWFRIVDVAVKSTAFTFGTVLALYLLGSAVGCLVAVVRVERIRRPLHAFLLCQCAILALAGLAVVVLVRLPERTPFYDWFFAYWGAYRFFPFGRSLDALYVTRLYVVLPVFLFALPTVLMGFSFPALQRAVHDEARTSGRKVGTLQAANIGGCVAGSLLVGLVSLHWLGTAGTLRFLCVLGLAFAAVGWRHYGRVYAGTAALLLVVAAALPGNDALWRRLNGVLPGEGRALFEEDATGVVAVAPEASGRWRLAVNGKGNSWLPYGGVHTALGALPAVIHPAPNAVAVIGLGSGDTVWAAACRKETETVTVFEIASPQPRILRRLAERQPFAGLEALLRDPRVALRLEDGRHALAVEGASYDLVEADAIWPESAYSGNLYSEEFFAGCARRLREGGVMCTWAPTPRVHATFARVFPHVLAAGGGVALVGSLQPLEVDVAAWTARLEEASAYLGPGRTRAVLGWLRGCTRAGDPPDLAPNRDLFPRDEFASGGGPGRRSP